MSESPLQTRIQAAIKDAMRAKDNARRDALRLAASEFKNVEVNERIELDDARVLAILTKMLKQRNDSLTQYREAGRVDLADQEAFEINVLEEFMPAQMDAAEISRLIEEAVAATGAASMKDMGKVMGLLKPKLAGRADMGAVSKQIKEKLG